MHIRTCNHSHASVHTQKLCNRPHMYVTTQSPYIAIFVEFFSTPSPSANPCSVSVDDLFGAVGYAFHHEVPMHSIISGSAFSALLQFVMLLEQAS